MDLAALQKWRKELERMPCEQRMSVMKSIEPVEIAGKQAPLLATPMYMEPHTFNAFNDAAQKLVDATIAIESHDSFRSENVLYDQLYESLSVQGKKLIDTSKKPAPNQIKKRFRRLDGFITQSGKPMFIEINQSAPLAISFYERAREYVDILHKDTALCASNLYMDLARWFTNELAGQVQSRSAIIAVSMERGYPAKFIDLPIACKGIAEAASALNWQLKFVLAEPTEFTYSDSTGARVRGEKFDLLWRNTVYLQNYPEELPDYQSIRYGDVPMVNDLYAWLFRSKGFFAMIWDDGLLDEFSRFGIDAHNLRDIIPESYFVSTYKPTDKHEWILKRCDDGFGRGIVFGANIHEHEWEEYLTGEHGKDWILQRLVEPLTLELPVVQHDGNVKIFEGVCDFNPYVVNGEVSGVLVRALPHKNVATKMNIVEGALIGFAATTIS